MDTISLSVSQKVLDQVAKQRESQKQLAIRDCSPGIKHLLSQASRHKRTPIRLGGCVNLMVGDTGAIWRSHNEAHLADFDSIYDLLSRRPGTGMTFVCDAGESAEI
jgi:hypothetical protein